MKCDKCNGKGSLIKMINRIDLGCWQNERVYCKKCNSTGEIKDKTNMNNDWKDLDRKTPVGVLLNMDKYDIQFKSGLDGRWVETDLTDGVELYNKIMEGELKYRYKRKPLESIRIPQEMLDDFNKGSHLGSRNGERLRFLERKYGRKVEIID